ncbi:4-amino-4-deoxy-L-arabinose transferase-like glycosyltransferase [Catenulispora sp. GAS73]|uniref:glycosyltransferase family 39 protein n=1 Tax=Catenulispora sp. GAS73 TaxID=3156269 RepID=UPI003513F905
MAALAVLLTALSFGYGFERDELYFRTLRPAWGYVDTPPLTPLLARLAGHVSGSPWAMRVPATVFAVGSVLVVVLITRELGGGRGAQALCAWSYAFAATPLLMGHVLLTSSLDLVVWPLVCLFVIRALMREEPRWWPAVGAVIGVSTYNKLLVSLLIVALALGMLITGPRRALATRWLAIGAGVALIIAVPNLIYQATHSWPQLTMSRALSKHNAGSVRILMWPYLFLLLGPPLVPVWVAGLVTLRRRQVWRAVRFLPTAFVVLLLETFAGGGQLYYPVGLLVVVFAAGCVPTAEFLARSTAWRRTAWVAFCVNGAVSSVIALPLIPLSVLHDTPVPSINQLAKDQVGWPDYVAQTAAVYATIPASEAAHSVIITSNYGEAGAILNFGGAYGLPRPYSGHVELYFDRRPPQDTTTAVIVGGQLDHVSTYFAECTVVAHLHNRYGVDNEERGQPVAICRKPVADWATLWPAFQHYD